MTLTRLQLSASRNCYRQASLTGQAVELSKRAGGGHRPPSLWSQLRVWVFTYLKFTGDEGGFVAQVEETWEEAVRM